MCIHTHTYTHEPGWHIQSLFKGVFLRPQGGPEVNGVHHTILLLFLIFSFIMYLCTCISMAQASWHESIVPFPYCEHRLTFRAVQSLLHYFTNNYSYRKESLQKAMRAFDLLVFSLGPNACHTMVAKMVWFSWTGRHVQFLIIFIPKVWRDTWSWKNAEMLRYRYTDLQIDKNKEHKE